MRVTRRLVFDLGNGIMSRVTAEFLDGRRAEVDAVYDFIHLGGYWVPDGKVFEGILLETNLTHHKVYMLMWVDIISCFKLSIEIETC